MRKVAVALVAVLMVSGCSGERPGTTASAAPSAPSATATSGSPEAVVTGAPVPAWRLATLPELAGPTSVLWDVVSVDATHAWAVGSEVYSPAQPNDTGTR